MKLMNYDEWLSALCIWREARGASAAAQTAIYHVILNRATDAQKRWPTTIPGVILQLKQFSSFNVGDPNAVLFPNPYYIHDWEAFESCQAVVTAPLGGDPTLGANGYESLPEADRKPAWADPAKIVCTIGPFRFYKL